MHKIWITLSACALLNFGITANAFALDLPSGVSDVAQDQASDMAKEKAVDMAVEKGGDMANEQAKEYLTGGDTAATLAESVGTDPAAAAVDVASDTAKDAAMESAVDKATDSGKGMAKDKAMEMIK